MLTSGTTGRPRGVVLSARALAASADAWLAALPPATGWALALGLAHVAGLGVLWRAVAAGVPVCIVPPSDPPRLLLALASDPAPSHVSLVPGQLARLLDACRDGPPPATLRAVLLGGGIVPPALVLRAVAAGWPVVPTYGLSEMGSGVTALPAAEAADAPGTAGRFLPGVTVVIENAGADGVGEIVVSGPARCSGYVGEPATDAAVPVRTGDLGRLDDTGRLVVVDRRTDRIVRGGENIAPAEVEAVLLAHQAVADAAVVGRPDALWGRVPVAAIVLAERANDPGDEALAAHARASLAGFKVPAAFTRLDALPRGSGGKLRREAVRALLAGEPVGELARPGGDAIGWRVTGNGPLQVVLLHGTLSTAAQLDRLAAALAAPGDVTVHALDRRGSGSSRLADPRPLDIAIHVADTIAYLDARGIDRAALVGVSYGGCLALETAARQPDRVSAVVAYEPPYGAVADRQAAPLVPPRGGGDHRRPPRRWRPRRSAGLHALGGRRWRMGPPAAPVTGLPGGRGRRRARGRGPHRPGPGRPGADHRARRDRHRRRERTLLCSDRRCPCRPHSGSATRPRAGRTAHHAHHRSGADRGPDPRLPGAARMTMPPPDHTPSGASTGSGNAAGQPEVRVMFDRIARRYDLMNLLISAFQEPRWRRRLVSGTGVRPGGAALDVASGTGKVAADLHRRVQPGGRVLGVDLSPGMTRVARGRYAGRAASSTSWATRWRCPPTTGPSTPPPSPSACATCPTTAGASPRWRAPSAPAAGSCASRSPAPGAAWRGSCAGGSTASSPSSADSSGRAPRTSTS